MRFYIVTPSYSQRAFLERCVASVADQVTEGEGRAAFGVGENRIEIRYRVQDAGSADGTVGWLHQCDTEVGGRQTEDVNPNAKCQ